MPPSRSPVHCHSWRALRGDTSTTPRFALITGAGATVDLTEWDLRAQVRRASDDALLFVFALEAGIVLGSATVRLSDGRPAIETSTARLRLHPGDFAALPPRGRLVYDLEGTRPRDGLVKTFVAGSLELLEDVTR